MKFFRGYEIFEIRHTRSFQRNRTALFYRCSRVAVFFESNQSGVNWTKKRGVKVYLPSCRTNREVNQNGELSINKQPL